MPLSVWNSASTNGTRPTGRFNASAASASNAKSNEGTPWWRDPLWVKVSSGGTTELNNNTRFKVANSEKTIDLLGSGQFFPEGDTVIIHIDRCQYLLRDLDPLPWWQDPYFVETKPDGVTQLKDNTKFDVAGPRGSIILPYECQFKSAADTLITHTDGHQYLLRDLIPCHWWRDPQWVTTTDYRGSQATLNKTSVFVVGDTTELISIPDDYVFWAAGEHVITIANGREYSLRELHTLT